MIENRNKIIEYFNDKNGTCFRMNSARINDRFDWCDEHDLTDEQIIEIIDESDNDREIDPTNIYEVLQKRRLMAWKKSKKIKTEIIEHQKKVMTDEPQLQLGLLEKTLAKVMIEEYAPKLAEATHDAIDEYIKDTYGNIERKITYSIPQRGGKMEEITHEKFEEVLNFVLADEPVMLVGQAGTGKNVICKQVAKAMNLDFYFTNAVTQEHKLTGFIDANGNYHETEFYKAFKNGGLFMLDELDASIPEVLVILNAAIANRYFDFPNGKIEANENFRLIAAANTFGTGASYIYTGRNQLDGASLDRFAMIEINYSERIENSLTDDKDLLWFVREFRKQCEENGINHITSYRSIIRLNKLKDVMPKDELLKTCLTKNLDGDDLNMLVEHFKPYQNEWGKALEKLA